MKIIGTGLLIATLLYLPLLSNTAFDLSSATKTVLLATMNKFFVALSESG